MINFVCTYIYFQQNLKSAYEYTQTIDSWYLLQIRHVQMFLKTLFSWLLIIFGTFQSDFRNDGSRRIYNDTFTISSVIHNTYLDVTFLSSRSYLSLIHLSSWDKRITHSCSIMLNDNHTSHNLYTLVINLQDQRNDHEYLFIIFILVWHYNVLKHHAYCVDT